MDRKPKPIYLFVVLVSLLIFGISLSIVLLAKYDVIVSMIILEIIIFVTVLFFIVIANKLNTDGFKTKMYNKISCPTCGKLVSSNANYCKYCGSSIEQLVECDYCSHQNPFDSEVCEKCGGILK